MSIGTTTPAPPSASAMPVASAEKRRIDVVAGVIRDARGRILLARRTEGRDLAGMWEFPGGKREPGETAEAALARELHEELGIDVEIGAPLINVPQAYPDKRLSLDVRHITRWRGSARGREGQALVWVPPNKLPGYVMPPADRPVVAALLQPAHYLVTPTPGEEDAPWLDALAHVLANGVARVQLRAPGLGPVRWRSLAAKAVDLCRQAGAEVLVNADAMLAAELGTGLHLTSALLHAQRGRPVPTDVPLAASCHHVDDLLAAQALGCDFAVLGSLKPTPSHPELPGIGWKEFARLRESVSLPLYAIGGVTPADLDEARRHGAQGVAAIRSLWPAA